MPTRPDSDNDDDILLQNDTVVQHSTLTPAGKSQKTLPKTGQELSEVVTTLKEVLAADRAREDDVWKSVSFSLYDSDWSWVQNYNCFKIFTLRFMISILLCTGAGLVEETWCETSMGHLVFDCVHWCPWRPVERVPSRNLCACHALPTCSHFPASAPAAHRD